MNRPPDEPRGTGATIAFVIAFFMLVNAVLWLFIDIQLREWVAAALVVAALIWAYVGYRRLKRR